MDLNEAHAAELREAFARFTKAARKTGGRARTAVRSSSSNAKEVRQWAQDQGMQVNTRGRIQADIMEKYNAAH
ncbi:histone-like nucleoid-structuring protein Lsr2 [Arthrobacter sp. PsM3]|uniref:histone-like nucleoid-structuring protein Lsr2 n=1 Tax=Arthrobacter sp. PsM3 TaxID=3030531 RepID=UPI003F885E87